MIFYFFLIKIIIFININMKNIYFYIIISTVLIILFIFFHQQTIESFINPKPYIWMFWETLPGKKKPGYIIELL